MRTGSEQTSCNVIMPTKDNKLKIEAYFDFGGEIRLDNILIVLAAFIISFRYVIVLQMHTTIFAEKIYQKLIDLYKV